MLCPHQDGTIADLALKDVHKIFQDVIINNLDTRQQETSTSAHQESERLLSARFSMMLTSHFAPSHLFVHPLNKYQWRPTMCEALF